MVLSCVHMGLRASGVVCAVAAAGVGSVAHPSSAACGYPHSVQVRGQLMYLGTWLACQAFSQGR
jgi:hypothetical protein